MFYSVYDILVKRIDDIDKDKKLINEGFTKEEIRSLKSNSNIPNVESLKNKILDFLNISELELEIMLGIIPEEYRDSYYSNLHEFVSKLKCGKKTNKTKRINAYFQNEGGVLYKGDCIKVLNQIESNSVDLIFADPPFNLKKDYGTDRKDDMLVSEYIDWSIEWLDECVRILKPGGSLYVYNLPKWCIYYADYLNKRLVFKSWIAIDMKNSFPIKNRYTPSHYGLLYYVKEGNEYCFNKQRLPIQTCRHCGGEIKDYGGYKKKMSINGVNIADVWYDIYPVRTHKNRKYNELSMTLLDRVISFSSTHLILSLNRHMKNHTLLMKHYMFVSNVSPIAVYFPFYQPNNEDMKNLLYYVKTAIINLYLDRLNYTLKIQQYALKTMPIINDKTLDTSLVQHNTVLL